MIGLLVTLVGYVIESKTVHEVTFVHFSLYTIFLKMQRKISNFMEIISEIELNIVFFYFYVTIHLYKKTITLERKIV